MQIVIFGLTASPSSGHAHASFWHGLWRSLAAQGHRVVFFERVAPVRDTQRDLAQMPTGELVLYEQWPDIVQRARQVLRSADVAIVTSLCPDGIDATAEALDGGTSALKVFYDMDPQVTLDKLGAGEDIPYIGPTALREFDLVLSRAGGLAVEALRAFLGAREVRTLYGHVDAQENHRTAPDHRYRCALSYFDDYGADRHAGIAGLLVEPARQLPQHAFLVGGRHYPPDLAASGNLRFVAPIPRAERPAAVSSSRLTLSLTGRAMAACGHCPSTRLFEAIACGTPVLSDWWPGLDGLFMPGRDILVARTTHEVMDALAMDDEELGRIAENGRERVLAQHTPAHRAQELVQMLEEMRPTERQALAA